MLKKSILFLLITSALMTGGFVKAISLKVSPAEISITAVKGGLSQAQLTVENPANDVAIYEVYADDFSDWFIISPASFVLESKAKKEVVLQFKPSEDGLFSTDISVVAKPMANSKIATNSGVKIPFQANVTIDPSAKLFIAKMPFLPIGYMLILVLGLFLILTFTFRKKMLRSRNKNSYYAIHPKE